MTDTLITYNAADGTLSGYGLLWGAPTAHGNTIDRTANLTIAENAPLVFDGKYWGSPDLPAFVCGQLTDDRTDADGLFLTCQLDASAVAVRRLLDNRPVYFCPPLSEAVLDADGRVLAGVLGTVNLLPFPSYPPEGWTLDAYIAWMIEHGFVASQFKRQSAPDVSLGIVAPAFPIDPILLPPTGVVTPPAQPPAPKPKGSIPVVTWTSTQAWISLNYPGLASPTYLEITPPTLGSAQIQQAIFDLSDLSVKTLPVYLLASDNTNSYVWYTKNALQRPPVWSKGAALSGQYTLLRLTDTPGKIAAYVPGGQTWSHTFDFTASDGGFTAPDTTGSGPNGTYVSGQGWHSAYTHGGAVNDGYQLVNLTFSLPGSCTMSGMSAIFDRTQGDYSTEGPHVEDMLKSNFPTFSFYDQNSNSGPTGPNQVIAGNLSAPSSTSLYLQIFSGHHVGAQVDPGGSVLLKSLTISGTGTNPFGGGGGSGQAQINVSSNYGSTFSGAVNIGTTPGVKGGFDVCHAGQTVLAAQDTKVRRSTDLGATWADEPHGGTTATYPLLITIPWYRLGSASTKQGATGTPDYILGSAAPISGSGLWLVTPGGGQVDITPTSGAVPVSENCCTIWKGTRIAALLSVSGATPHLWTGTISGGLSVSWTDQGAVNYGWLRGAYHAAAAGPLFAAGAGGAAYSADFAATALNSRSIPASPIVGLEPGA